MVDPRIDEAFTAFSRLSYFGAGVLLDAGGLDQQEVWLTRALVVLRQEEAAVKALLQAEALEEARRNRT